MEESSKSGQFWRSPPNPVGFGGVLQIRLVLEESSKSNLFWRSAPESKPILEELQFDDCFAFSLLQFGGFVLEESSGFEFAFLEYSSFVSALEANGFERLGGVSALEAHGFGRISALARQA